MKISNTPCPDCGELLVDVSGFGQTDEELKCNNPACPSHFEHIKCPECGSDDKGIEILGLGDQRFTCNNCGHVWESI